MQSADVTVDSVACQPRTYSGQASGALARGAVDQLYRAPVIPSDHTVAIQVTVDGRTLTGTTTVPAARQAVTYVQFVVQKRTGHLVDVGESRDRAVLMRRDSLRLASLARRRCILSRVRQPSDARNVSADLARTVDAEVRVAMFELASGEELRGAEPPRAPLHARRAGLVERRGPERAALHFLLAQSYYRLGMLAPFRREAEAALAAGQSRYASVLRPQLLVEAYRTGDYARAATLARDIRPAKRAGWARS